MQVIGGNGKGDLNRRLLNKVFPYNRKIYNRIKSFTQESATGFPYMDALMVCMMTEIIIRLLQLEDVAYVPATRGILRHNSQDELLDHIIAYIDDRIYDRITVESICRHFSISRSALQLLFKDTLKQTPKRYICDLKLEKSCQLLRENKYTVSDIAKKLGFSSIHSFSNTFSQKYHIPPSEYANRIY